MELLLKTSPGIEDLVLEECSSLLGQCIPKDRRRGEGRLYVTATGDPYKLVTGSRLLTSVILVLLKEDLECTEENCEDTILKKARSISWSSYLSWGDTFAVRAERVGEFPLTSPQVAMLVGKAVEESIEGIRVHLSSPSRVIAAEIDWGKLVLGVQLGGDIGLHRRWYRVQEHIASLKPTLANAMLLLSGVEDGQYILDPLCGGGTIPIEALLYYEWIRATCSDKSMKSIEVARANAAAAGVQHRIEFIRSDVSSIHEKLEGQPHHIVTNPPYGLRIGNPRVALKVLDRTFKQASNVLAENGRLTILFPNINTIEKLATVYGMEIIHKRKVKHGDLELWLIVTSKSPA